MPRYAIYFGRSIAVPVITAIFAYLTLRPVVPRGRRLGIPRRLSAAGVMCFLTLLVLVGSYLLFQPAKRMAAEQYEAAMPIFAVLGVDGSDQEGLSDTVVRNAM